jgi:hypothetical protein
MVPPVDRNAASASPFSEALAMPVQMLAGKAV